jgi:hypothetical protein
MRLIELPPFTLRDLATTIEVPARSVGVHVTQITGAIMRRIDPKRYGREFDRAGRENYQETGFLWEEILGRAIAFRAIDGQGTPWGLPEEFRFRPGEIERDGIIGSPDAFALLPTADAPVIEEYKATWKSMTPFLTPDADDAKKLSALEDKRYLGYLLQIKSYCAMVHADRARLVIFFINGDYTKMAPVPRAFELQFGLVELEEHWMMIGNVARKEGWLAA